MQTAGGVILLGLAGGALFVLALATDANLPLVDGGREATLRVYVIPLGVPALALALTVGRSLGALKTVALVAVTWVCVAAFSFVAWGVGVHFSEDDPYGCPGGRVYC